MLFSAGVKRLALRTEACLIERTDDLWLRGGVAKILLNPRLGWEDRDAYDAQAAKLAGMFRDNFTQYLDYVDDAVKAAAI